MKRFKSKKSQKESSEKEKKRRRRRKKKGGKNNFSTYDPLKQNWYFQREDIMELKLRIASMSIEEVRNYLQEKYKTSRTLPHAEAIFRLIEDHKRLSNEKERRMDNVERKNRSKHLLHKTSSSSNGDGILRKSKATITSNTSRTRESDDKKGSFYKAKRRR